MTTKNSFYCPNCKGYSSLSSRTSYNKNLNGLHLTYSVEECNSCDFHFLTIRRQDNDSLIKIYPKILPQKVDNLVPSPMKEDFEEALQCYSVGAYRGAAALARRTVQVICIDKGASEKRKLYEQIDELFTNGVITKDIQQWAHEVRFLGNDAAHPTKNNVSDEEARDILDLLESLCGVLYVTPAKASERKKKREEAKSHE